MSAMRILLAGGGSGGHVFPAFAVSDALRNALEERGDRVKFRFAGTALVFHGWELVACEAVHGALGIMQV